MYAVEQSHWSDTVFKSPPVWVISWILPSSFLKCYGVPALLWGMQPNMDEILNALKLKHILDAKCTLCEGRQWAIADGLYFHDRVLKNGAHQKAQGSVALICNTCGDIHFLAWEKLGRLPKSTPSGPAKESETYQRESRKG